jgi:superfamily II DNA or RNA helicase
MTNNEKRILVHEQAKQSFLTHKKGILHISMGVGKTKIAIDLINTDSKTLVVAPFNSVLDSWKEEFIKWNKSDANVVYTTTASLGKHTKNTFDLVVLDEIHLYSINQLSKVPHGRLLGLTGTLSDSSAAVIKEQLNLDVIFSYDIEQAIRDGIIADYRVKVIEVSLDDSLKYIQGGTKLKPFLTTEKAQYDYLTKQFNQIKFAEWNAIGADKRKYALIKMQFASKRAKLIYSCKSKIDAANRIISKYSNDRILIFTTLTDSANQLCEHQYHSKADKKNLDRFSDGEIDRLAVVNMANVGLNIKPLHRAVVHQFQSSEETAQQRMGRLLRLEYNNPEKIAEIHVVCAVNTVDEDWVKSALKNVPRSKLEYIHYKNL